MTPRQTVFLSLCGTATVLCLITFHLLGRYYLDRAHPSHLLTLDLQNVTLRQALEQSFHGLDIHFETEESAVPRITIRAGVLSSIHFVRLLELDTKTVIYRRGERIVIAPRSGWYRFFSGTETIIYKLSGIRLWTSHGKL